MFKQRPIIMEFCEKVGQQRTESIKYINMEEKKKSRLKYRKVWIIKIFRI